MKIAAVIAVLLAAFWVWHHHTATASSACLTAPARVCVDRPTTTARRR